VEYKNKIPLGGAQNIHNIFQLDSTVGFVSPAEKSAAKKAV